MTLFLNLKLSKQIGLDVIINFATIVSVEVNISIY